MNPYWWIPIGIGSLVGLVYLWVAIALLTIATFLVLISQYETQREKVTEFLGFAIQAFKWPAYAYAIWLG